MFRFTFQRLSAVVKRRFTAIHALLLKEIGGGSIFFKFLVNTNEKYNVPVCDINFTRCEESLLLRQTRDVVYFHKQTFLAEGNLLQNFKKEKTTDSWKKTPWFLGKPLILKGIFLNGNYVAVLLSFKSRDMEIQIHLELDQTQG